MKIKSLLFGVAGSIAVTGAQAADLPAPEPVDYVRICDAFGTGFYYIPGTETCIRVFGRLRADYNLWSAQTGVYTAAAAGTEQGWRFRARAYIRVDTRTNTEFGLLRTFIDLWITNDNVSVNQAPFAAPRRGTITLFSAFIQFGGLTAGRTASFLDTGFGTTYGFFWNAGRSSTWTNVLAYTFAFGNGVSASISLEGVGGTFSAAGTQLGVYSGYFYPDIVANVRVDQGWGSAQLSLIAHHNRLLGVINSYGWGGNLGVNFAIPSMNATAFIQGAYGNGAIAAVHASWDCAFCFDFNAVGARTRAWSISGGLGFALTPQVSAGVEAGYMSHNFAAPAGVGDFTRWDLQGQISYRPVAGLLFGFAVEYRRFNFGAAGVGNLSDVAGLFRIQRDY